MNNSTLGGFNSSTDFYVDTDTLYVDVSEDKVGINTDAPDEALHVFNGSIDTRGSNVENSTVQLYFDANNGDAGGTSNDLGPGITWKPAYSGYSKRSAGILQIGEGNYFRSGLGFFTNNTSDVSTDWSERMRLSMEGNLGIGVQALSAVERLTVSGNISAHGGLSATGARSYFACNIGVKMQANDNALSLPDSAILALGTSSDLQLSHSAPHSYITNTQNEGNLIIQNCGNDHDLILKTDDGYGGTAAYLQLDGGNQEVYISTGLPASAGNVGISTTTPTEKLTVAGNISATGGLSASGPVSYFGGKVGISNSTQTFDYGGSDNETALHLKSSGDVALILEADTDNSGESDNPKIKLIQDGGAVIGNIFMNGNNAASNRIPANAMVMGTNNDYPVAITQNNYAAINITDAGCVAMGTCAPDTANRLTVKGNISASGAVCSPHVCGITTVCAPTVCGTTAVCAPVVCGTNCVTTTCMIASTCTIACASNIFIDNGGYKLQFGQSSSCHELMFYYDMYYCNYTGDVYMQQGAQNKDIIFKTCDGSLKETMRIDGSAQKVGIGTSAPGESLTVVGNISAGGATISQTGINAQTGTTYTLLLADHGKLVTLNNGSAITLTIPPNSTAAFPTGTEITLTQLGAGQVTIAAGSGVTAYAADAELKTRVQYSSAVLTKIASDTWLIAGDLTA